MTSQTQADSDNGQVPATRLKLAASSSLLSSGSGLEAASSEEESKLKLRRPAEFDELVAPLEEAGDGRRPLRLNGPGREWCLAAFAADPEGFAACAERALERWEEGRSQRPLGLLCQMVRAGEHLASAADDAGSSVAGEAPAPTARPLTREEKKRILTKAGLKILHLGQARRACQEELGDEVEPDWPLCSVGGGSFRGECRGRGDVDGYVRWDDALGFGDDAHGVVLCVDCAISWLNHPDREVSE